MHERTPDLTRSHLPGDEGGPDPAASRPEAYTSLSYSPLQYADVYGRATPTNKGTFAVVGAGAAGFTLAYGLVNKGYKLVQVLSKTHDEAAQLPRKLGIGNVSVGTDVKRLLPTDWLLLTVPDDAIRGVAEELAGVVAQTTTVLHVAGSQPITLLEPLGLNVGVCWPMQTLNQQKAVDLRAVPLFVEGTSRSRSDIERLARELSDKVFVTDHSARLRLHIGAVFAANFVNLMVRLAGDLALTVPGADYSIYLPLLQESVDKLRHLTPHQAQTGPASRGDENTLIGHLDVLTAYDPELAKLYEWLTRLIKG